MSNYSTYTDGEAFLLNGSNYVGFFHIKDNVPYSERVHNTNSVELVPRKTFISELYGSLGVNDTTFKHISAITPYYSNVFDILNKQGLDTAIGSVDHNNLICFKNLILGHPTIYQFEKNSGFFYGLSSANIDIPTGKTDLINIDPFSMDTTWEFMDSVKSGTFLIDSDENFKYVCSTGTDNYIVAGSFVDKNPLVILQHVNQHPDLTKLPRDYRTDYTYHIHHDIDNERILMVNTDWIDVYDSSNYESCNNPLSSNLIDRINLTPTTTTDYIWNRTHIKWSDLKVKWTTRFTIANDNSPQFIKFGRNLRTGISNNILYLSNKYSSDLYQSIDLLTYGVSDVITLDIRDTDDVVIILHRKIDGLYIITIDSQNITDINSTKLESIRTDLFDYHIKFSNIDSNVFCIYDRYEYQSRYLSAPKYPSGRLENSDLLYPMRYKWKETIELWKYIKYKWGSLKNGANIYNNIFSTELVKSGKMYLMHQNIGRLYVVRQPLSDRFLSAVPLDLEKTYSGTACSESSLGLYFNSSISNIVRDILNIFTQASGSFSIYERHVIGKNIDDFILETENLYINGNETISIVTLQRIFLLITQIQTALLPDTIEI